MNPPLEEPTVRYFHLRFKDGKEIEIRAAKLCKPDDTSNSYRLKLDGHVVAEYGSDDVVGWRVTESGMWDAAAGKSRRSG